MNDIMVCEAATAQDMQQIGFLIGKAACGGDVIMLDGPLGAGKTTFTQGVARGLGISGRIQSPTFVIAMVHPNDGDGPDLVHVDAYRLSTSEELDALDIDASLEESVTVIEWGEGKTEVLSDDRLRIRIIRPEGSPIGASVDDLYDESVRQLHMTASGPRSRELIRVVEVEYAA